jgi:serine/threonine protein kinase
MGRLKPNQELCVDGSTRRCQVRELLGEGGQGEVYRVQFEGQNLALKWYFRNFATSDQRLSLNYLIRRGSPNERFLWPIALVSTIDGKGLGYLMRLRDKDYEGIASLLRGRISPSFRALCTAGIQLSDSYFQLHARGLCYRDISLGNAFLDPVGGNILICDNDNVAVNKGSKAAIMGTPRFMAPEVVRGEALPSTQTDLFSLGVLLFYFFMLHHPFEGMKDSQIHCLDGTAMDELYGRNPVFIFDPDDKSNAPDPRYHGRVLRYWDIYPQFLRAQFTHAFTDGIRDPEKRIRESEWRRDLARLQDSIVYCNCQAENFFDETKTEKPRCWACGAIVPVPFKIQIEDRIVTLNHDRQLFPHHLDGTSYDFTSPVAAVTENPAVKGSWGLKNLTGAKWVVALADGSMRDLEPGRSVALKSGTKIHFGKAQGEIRG